MPSKDASGRELSDLALRILEAVAKNDGEATVDEIAAATGDGMDEVGSELGALVRSGHLAGPPRTTEEVSYGLLPAGRVALRLR